MHVETLAIDRVIPYPGNPRRNEGAIAKTAASLKEFGWRQPVVVDEAMVVVVGHTRLLAARSLGMTEIPVHIARELTPAQIRAYRLADNRTGEEAEWDDTLLAEELKLLKADHYDLTLTAFDDADISALLEPNGGIQGGGDLDEIPEPPATPITKLGDLIVLGRHRLLCGDSRKPDDIVRLMDGATATCVHADPPYGMGKEADGVENDNLNATDLNAFQLAWWRAFRPHLSANASAYIWGNAPDLWRLWYAAGLGATEPLTLRNEIVWDKKNIAGMASSDLTMYPIASERCLFFQFGRHVFLVNQTKDDYWEGWDQIRLPLVAERDRAGFSTRDVRAICGNHMHGHWFGTSQWSFISRENYEKLAAAAKGAAFTRPYAELHAEYKGLLDIFSGSVRDPRRLEFNAARPYFDNAHDVMRDVWEFARVTGEERHDHATPKPVAMMERVITSSTRPGEIVVEPFGGSGSTLIAAEKTGRSCFTVEITPAYCDVIVTRWEKLTGQKAARP